MDCQAMRDWAPLRTGRDSWKPYNAFLPALLQIVVEAANGPTTPEGDAILRQRGIVALPDIFTNGGGWAGGEGLKAGGLLRGQLRRGVDQLAHRTGHDLVCLPGLGLVLSSSHCPQPAVAGDTTPLVLQGV